MLCLLGKKGRDLPYRKQHLPSCRFRKQLGQWSWLGWRWYQQRRLERHERKHGSSWRQWWRWCWTSRHGSYLYNILVREPAELLLINYESLVLFISVYLAFLGHQLGWEQHHIQQRQLRDRRQRKIQHLLWYRCGKDRHQHLGWLERHRKRWHR